MEILIIGGIAAGMSVAAKAKRVNSDANITVIEREDYVSFGACGLPYYIGGQFDDQKEMFARTPEQMRKAGINVLLKHEATSVDFKNKTVTLCDLNKGEIVEKKYDRLMIATGASAVIPPIKNVEAENVFTITKPYTVKILKDNLHKYNDIVVIGGGFIGVETAEQLAHLNKNVHLIHSRDALMNGPFDLEFSEKLQMATQDAGVTLHMEQRANSFILKDELVSHVETNDSKLKADAVILAVGFTPNTQFLKGQLDTLENGAIIIDKFGQTSQPDVFAAGDCATVPHRLADNQYIPLATYANKLGRLIGSNIVSDKKEWLAFNGALGTSAIKVGAYEAVATGLTEKAAIKLNYNISTTLIHTSNHSNYYPNQEKIMIKLVYDKETFVLYGAQLFGKNETVLRATGLTTAIHAGLTTQEIGFIDYAYSPPFASTWEAINVAANTAK